MRVLEGKICGSIGKEFQRDQDRKQWKGMELRTPRKRNVGTNGNFWPLWTPNDMQVEQESLQMRLLPIEFFASVLLDYKEMLV